MKNTIISIIVSAALIIFAIVLTSGKTNNESSTTNSKTEQETNIDNVSNIPASTQGGDGKQIIEIRAKGGYNPRKSIAKAGIPTILRLNTNGTFDCSSSVRIPSMNIFKNLPQSGSTDIDLGTQKTGTLDGSCGMGMYPFQIEFQ